jgi:hypothetical protein
MRDIKATLLRWSELPWSAIKQFNQFMFKSTFCRDQITTPSLRVAIATDENGEPLVVAPVETVLLLSGFAISPNASKEEARRCGYLIDVEVAALGQQLGIGKVIIVIPKDAPALLEEDGWQEIRTYTRKIPQSAAIDVVIPTQSRSAAYLN